MLSFGSVLDLMSAKLQDFFMNSTGKRKREDFPPQYHNGGYIPQQDGAADSIYDNIKAGLLLIH